ncbi:hypothetical protein Desal_1852 [Maridesulfovibrio salexigens DSM 2638]|uniref:DUF4136 domain-containing protein n=2 Tax=Maridesulfovibrio salexigens TaxID=880 RepID=C6BUA4_MARSD|nr:hypothetical protein Desal_1852 [Maridesulfovibrio salexigens DSM 2638]
MRNKLLLIFVVILSMFSLGGCSTRTAIPPTPLSAFNPSLGSFNVRVVLFQLNKSGSPERVETGSLPIAQNMIQTLAEMGYKYQPNGEVDYLIEARVGSISPKVAAHGAQQQVGFSDSLPYGPSFRRYPVLVNTWSPQIERAKSAPNTCYLVVELLVEKNKGQKETVIYSGSPDPIEVPYELGCPFAKCSQGVNQGISNFLRKRFVPTKN